MSTASTPSQRNVESTRQGSGQQEREITRDLVDYVTEYARENPAQVALWCLGIGFVLGWKLKPW